MATTFGIKGAKEMEALLKELGPNVARKVAQQGALAGAKVIAEEAKRLVPVRTGELQASIVAVADKENNRWWDKVGAVIGFLKPTSGRAHLVEFGFTAEGGKQVAARPFIRPAMDSQAGEALNAMGRVMAKGIEREATKLAKV